jgi:integrase
VITKYLNAIGNHYTVRYDTIPLGKGEHPYVRYNNTGVIKTFDKWLDRIYGVGNPSEKVESPKLVKPIHPTLTIQEIKYVLSKQSARAKSIIALAAESGLRRFKLANVRVEDINWRVGKVRVLLLN